MNKPKIDTTGYLLILGVAAGLFSSGVGLVVFHKYLETTTIEWGFSTAVVGLIFLGIGGYALKNPETNHIDIKEDKVNE